MDSASPAPNFLEVWKVAFLCELAGGDFELLLTQLIINQFPPHHTYLELFCGSGAVMRLKRPAAVTLGLDIDPRPIEQLTALGYVQQAGCQMPVVGAAVAVGCALDFMARHRGRPGELLYLDPPYLGATRRGGRIYWHEMMDPAAHMCLLRRAVRIAQEGSLVALSGYPSELYSEMLDGWRRLDYEAMTRAGPALECLWMSYPEPQELHDYRFLGGNKAQKQNIRRKTSRWLTRLRGMATLERHALVAALDQLVTEHHDGSQGDYPA